MRPGKAAPTQDDGSKKEHQSVLKDNAQNQDGLQRKLLIAEKFPDARDKKSGGQGGENGQRNPDRPGNMNACSSAPGPCPLQRSGAEFFVAGEPDFPLKRRRERGCGFLEGEMKIFP